MFLLLFHCGWGLGTHMCHIKWRGVTYKSLVWLVSPGAGMLVRVLRGVAVGDVWRGWKNSFSKALLRWGGVVANAS